MKLHWVGEEAFEMGVSKGVLYLNDQVYVWNGITSVASNGPSDLRADLVYDGVRYASAHANESFGGSVEATGRPHILRLDGFSYMNGSILHVIYNPTFVISEKQNQTLNESTDIPTQSFVFTTQEELVLGYPPISHLEIDTASLPEDFWAQLSGMLYGTDSTAAYLPSLGGLLTLFESLLTLIITYNEDGTWTAIGSDVSVTGDTFTIDAPTLENNSEEYTVRSY